MTGIAEVYRRWPTHEACIQRLEQVRWGKSPTCPYCNAVTVARHVERGRDNRWQCWSCRKSFAVTVGTMFHHTHIDLQRWFLLISLMMSAKKGLSSLQASRDIGIQQPTTWKMMHRIRRAMADDGKLLAGIVEMDETYVGGKPRKANRRSDDPPGGQGVTTKTPIIGAVERDGRVKAKATTKAELTGDDMEATVKEMVSPKDTILTTDEHRGYAGVNKFMAHRTINHSVSFSERDLFADLYGATHTNTIEGFWAIVKRAIYGQFHWVSRKYLPLYLNELTWRYSERRNPDRFGDVLHLAIKPKTA